MKKSSVFALALVAVSVGAWAEDAGDWKVRAGAYMVAPKSDNSDLVTVDDGVSLGFNVTYYFTPNWALEVLAATPFTHDINLVGGDKVAETKHLPPTFTLQYHFDTGSSFHPYVGAGLNYTTFFDEKTTGALAGTDLNLDDSFGLALQLGADLDLSENWFVNGDVRWINIETDATLDGTPLGTVEIDPWVAGIELGRRF